MTNEKFENFIETLKKNRNILDEKGVPNNYVDGWSVWFFRDGNIRLSRLYVKPSENLSKQITEKLKQLGEQEQISIIIENANTKMINPDRCIYEAHLTCQ